MKIRKQILLGFLFLAVMLTLTGIWSVYELRPFDKNIPKFFDDNYTSINAAKKMTEALEREDKTILLILSGGPEKGGAILNSAHQLFQAGYKMAENHLTVPGGQACLDDIKSKYIMYEKLLGQMVLPDKNEKDLDWYFKEVLKAFSEVKDSVEKLKTLNEKTMYETASSLKKKALSAMMPNIVAILSTLVFTVVLGAITHKKIDF